MYFDQDLEEIMIDKLFVDTAQSIGSIPFKPKKCKNQIFTEKPGD